MLNSFRARSNCELEAKFIQDRISFIERNLAEFCYVFAQYARKAARLRDKGDEIAKVAINFAETETINKSLTVGLENFADSVTLVSDYGDIRVQMIDNKVVNEFSRYEDICKLAKDEVKDIYAARDREFYRKRQLDRIRERNPRNRQQLVQAETELVKATAEVSKSVHTLEEKTTSFERQKLHDIKSILLDFISIELGYHAKALEVFTKAFKQIESINEESDLEEFKKSLRTPDTIPHQLPKSSLFNSAQSFGSLGAIFSNSYHRRRSPGIPTDIKGHSKSEETLDSMKHSISDTEESLSDDSEDVTDKTSTDEDKLPPVVVKKFQK